MHDLKISTRISLGYLVITLAFLALAGIAVANGVGIKISQPHGDRNRDAPSCGPMAGKRPENSARSLAVAYSDGNAMLDLFKAGIKETTDQTTETQKAFLALARDPDSSQRAAAVGEVRTAWFAVRDQANALKAAGDGAAAEGTGARQTGSTDG